MRSALSALGVVLATGAFLFGCGGSPEPQVSGESTSAASPQVGSGALDAGEAAPDGSSFGFGRAATQEEIALLDKDVMPDGRGLPPGSGTVTEGREIYQSACVACHGATGTEGPQPRLVSTDPEGPSAIGNYWPYATTIFDYVRRAMPWDRPAVLDDGQVYALTAYLLFLNGLLPEDAVLDRETLVGVEMPARDRFVPDDRTGGRVIRLP